MLKFVPQPDGRVLGVVISSGSGFVGIRFESPMDIPMLQVPVGAFGKAIFFGSDLERAEHYARTGEEYVPLTEHDLRTLAAMAEEYVALRRRVDPSFGKSQAECQLQQVARFRAAIGHFALKPEL